MHLRINYRYQNTIDEDILVDQLWDLMLQLILPILPQKKYFVYNYLVGQG